MQLLIDGYNVLKKIKKTSSISDNERKNFIRQLNNYAHKKNLSIVIVFDGGPFSWPDHEKISNYLEVVYSGTRETADDYIKKYIENHKGQDILLVSSDRELITVARQGNIHSLDSYEFSNYLLAMETIKPVKKTITHAAQKITTTAHEELDALMEQLNINKIKKETETISRKIKSKKLSKEERKLLQKLKKL
jgi:predicted RNA-binding protein with PIN domain